MKIAKKIITLLVLILILPISSVYVYAHEDTDDKILCNATIEDDFSDENVLIVLNEQYNHKEYTIADFVDIGCESVNELTKTATETIVNNLENNLVNKEKYKRVLSLQLKNKTKENVLDAIDILISRDDVLYAGPNYIFSITSTVPDDTLCEEQWAIDNIKLPQTWDCYKGSNTILVGIIDSGIDGNHPDLSSKLVRSLCRDFSTGIEVNTPNPTDPLGHGTHVAGIIGAAGDNGQGITGVNWDVGLVSLRISDEYGNSSTEIVSMAIGFAQKNNIPILNFSNGTDPIDYDSDFDYAFNALIESYAGLFVAAAGNDGIDIDSNITSYPAICSAENMIVVGSIDSNNQRSIWSTYGSSNYGENSVDIYAPGSNILSTFPYSFCLEYSYMFDDGTHLCELPSHLVLQLDALREEYGLSWEYIDDNFSEIVTIDGLPVEPYQIATSDHEAFGYHYMDGTSMATPYVTGVAALLLSANPTLTTIELKAAILNGANILSITTSDNATQNVKKLNSYMSLNLIHSHTFSYVNIGTSHTVTCVCDYTATLSHVYDGHNCIHCGAYTSSHDYDYNYVWVDYRSHSACCECGETLPTLQPHAISSNSYATGQRFAICLLCGGFAEMGFIQLNINSSSVNNVTLNGSFILPNGVIILQDEDINAYLNGTLVFYNKNEVPVIK